MIWREKNRLQILQTNFTTANDLSIHSPFSRHPGAVQTAVPLLAGGRLGDGPLALPWGHRGAGIQRLFPPLHDSRRPRAGELGYCGSSSPQHCFPRAWPLLGVTNTHKEGSQIQSQRDRFGPAVDRKARQCPRKKGPVPELSLTLSSCSLPWTRRETVPSIGSAGYLSQAHITSKDNLPRAAESLRLISALLIASTPYLQGAGPGAPFKTLSVLIH